MFATVILDKIIDTPLEYSIPTSLIEQIRIGSRVTVPLKGRPVTGTVLFKHDECLFPRVEPIADVLTEEILFSDELYQVAEWLSQYYATPLRKTLITMIPHAMRSTFTQHITEWVYPLATSNKIAEYLRDNRHRFPKQAVILDYIQEHPHGVKRNELPKSSALQTLAKKGLLCIRERATDLYPFDEEEFFLTRKKTFNPEQAKAFQSIVASIDRRTFTTHLIHGITGSGKTEIYLQSIEEARNRNLDVIMLVPEIALTSQTIERIKSRFTEKIAILHHRLSPRERREKWHKMRTGEIHIVVGARSAVFAPLRNVGLIIVDEEQERSYKQTEEMPCYHARDVAIVRGMFTRSTVVLGSATPALESYHNAIIGKYQLHTLHQRAPGSHPPHVYLIDMRSEREQAQKYSLFSVTLLQALEKRLFKGEQSLLFLNRRGFFSCQKCTNCAEVIKCRHCDITLTFHKAEQHLACHLCGYILTPIPTVCPHCHADSAFKYQGPGTEQIERALHKIFPHIRTLRMDRDTTQKKKSHETIFKEFRAGKADVLIGTQMIAKGLHFPSVTLVGVINADAGLHVPDFRAHESCFQILTQVAGRSGRSAIQGEVLLQTSLSQHPVIQHASREDYPTFFEEEITHRALLDFPPFTQMAKVVVSGYKEEQTSQEIDRFFKLCKSMLPPSFIFYPPSPSAYAKVKNKYRFQFLVKGPKKLSLGKWLNKCLLQAKKRKYVHILIDIDTLHTFS